MQQFQYEIHFELSFCFSNVLGFAEGERIVREARQGRARGRRQERARQAAERYQGADGHQGHRGADGQVIQLCNFPWSYHLLILWLMLQLFRMCKQPQLLHLLLLE